MENQKPIVSTDSMQTDQSTINQNSVPQQTKGNFLPIVVTIIVCAALFGVGGYYFGKNLSNPTQNTGETQKNEVSPSSSPTAIIEGSPTPSTQTSPTPKVIQTKGVDLKSIKYTLPQGWDAKLNADSLFISPTTSGGYLSIKVYEYPTTIGRREYYCQVSKVCIEGTTYFTEMSVGNISGYAANALDNSGGGAEYFGAKGNKFYIISSYNPPSPNEFEKGYKQVMSSLIF